MMRSLLRIQGVLWADAVWERAALGGVLVAIGLMGLGSAWDVQWHATVGRDTIWIPPHQTVYSGTALAGALAVVMGLRSALLWQASGSLPLPWPHWSLVVGAGSATMTAAAGIDVLWHRTIGDALVWSPPHVMGTTGGLIILTAATIGLLRAERTHTVPPALAHASLAGLLGMLLVVAYHGLLSTSVLALLPQEIKLAFITSNPYVLPVLAALMVPAVVTFSRELPGGYSFGRIALTGVGLWFFLEVFHALMTPLLAEALGYAIRSHVIPGMHFKLQVLAFMLLPALIVHRGLVTSSWAVGATMGMLYSVAVMIWLRGLGTPSPVSVLGVAGAIALGALSAVGGIRWGRRIRQYGSAGS